MRLRLNAVLIAAALAACGQSSERAEGPAPAAQAPVQATAAPSALKWPATIAWQSWEAGVEQSRTTGKPILLVVYADWCARCKELAPAFDDPRVRALANKAIMVRQDQDAAPPWLAEQFGAYGNYVPRLFFVEPGGVVRDDLVSGHPRYPYFYAPIALDPLIANLRQITGG